MEQVATEAVDATEEPIESAHTQASERQPDPAPTEPVVATSTPGQSNIEGVQSFAKWQRTHATAWSWQVIGTTNRHKLGDFLQVNDLSNLPHSIVKTESAGADWWIVLAGLYPSREDAIKPRSDLPQALAGSAWLRQIQSIDGQAD